MLIKIAYDNNDDWHLVVDPDLGQSACKYFVDMNLITETDLYTAFQAINCEECKKSDNYREIFDKINEPPVYIGKVNTACKTHLVKFETFEPTAYPACPIASYKYNAPTIREDCLERVPLSEAYKRVDCLACQKTEHYQELFKDFIKKVTINCKIRVDKAFLSTLKTFATLDSNDPIIDILKQLGEQWSK